MNKGCEKCEYRGYIYVDRVEVKSCECVKENAIKVEIAKSNIPKRLIKLGLEDWNIKQSAEGEDLPPDQQKKKEKIFKLLETLSDSPRFPFDPIEESNSVIFYGNQNSGKTLCLTILCKAAIKRGAMVRFYDWYDLVATLERFDNKENLEEILYLFENCDLIAIDGIEKSDFGNQAKNQLNRIIRKRLNDGAWIICSASGTMAKEKLSITAWDILKGNSREVYLP